jgi:hypothetical protein
VFAQLTGTIIFDCVLVFLTIPSHLLTFGQLTFKKIRMASFLGRDCHGGMGVGGRRGAALAWKVPLADWFCLMIL